MTHDIIGKKFPVLDGGYVLCADAMGSDADIASAARISYGKGTRSVSDDRTLLRYLYRHHHSTPFEMSCVKLIIKAPLMIWRQIERHRAGRLCEEQCDFDDPSVNEYSQRYSEAPGEMLTTAPDAWRLQSKDNKQGSAGFLNPNGEMGAEFPSGSNLSQEEAKFQKFAIRVYQNRLSVGVAREQARKDLPLSTYTEAYVKFDLRNLLHFLGLRMESHAQQEVRAYADVIGYEIVAKLFPIAWEAFQDYHLGAMTLSATDQRIIQHVTRGETFETACEAWGLTNKREREECWAKLSRLGLGAKV